MHTLQLIFQTAVKVAAEVRQIILCIEGLTDSLDGKSDLFKM